MATEPTKTAWNLPSQSQSHSLAYNEIQIMESYKSCCLISNSRFCLVCVLRCVHGEMLLQFVALRYCVETVRGSGWVLCELVTRPEAHDVHVPCFKEEFGPRTPTATDGGSAALKNRQTPDPDD